VLSTACVNSAITWGWASSSRKVLASIRKLNESEPYGAYDGLQLGLCSEPGDGAVEVLTDLVETHPQHRRDLGRDGTCGRQLQDLSLQGGELVRGRTRDRHW
jgi:hypothetical protein